MNQDKLIIFDTTLRDGEQSPGASMTLGEKVRIAKILEKMRVDVIEAGFAFASPGDFKSIVAVTKAVKNSVICSLARAIDQDIDAAGKSLEHANASRIHTFIATSPIHMNYKLKMSHNEVLDSVVRAIKRARKWTDDIEFSPEDAGRSDFDFLCKVIDTAINAGATTINIPDTVGYNMPWQFGSLIKRLIENVANADKVIFSAHCHNDLGLAVANSLSAVDNGARQIECTINGLGERAGNTSLEEVVMSIRTRQDIFAADTNIETKHIVSASKLVSSITGFVVQPNKAIVGANAFAHEAGIHQDGILKHRQTYEIMKAEDVGWSANRLVLGKHSGRTAFVNKLKNLDIEFSSKEELNKAFQSFKDLADKKHEIFDEDLQALISASTTTNVNNTIELVDLKVTSRANSMNSAVVTLSIDGELKTSKAKTSGAVDAVYNAINQIAKIDCTLQLYSVSNVTQGTDAQGEVSVRLEMDNKIVNGKGFDTDIINASAKAYIDGLNKLKNYIDKVNYKI